MPVIHPASVAITSLLSNTDSSCDIRALSGTGTVGDRTREGRRERSREMKKYTNQSSILLTMPPIHPASNDMTSLFSNTESSCNVRALGGRVKHSGNTLFLKHCRHSGCVECFLITC